MLLLATGAAHAKTSKLPTVKVIQFMTSLPPAEYDKPYTGELTIRRLATEQEIHTICPNYGDTSHYTACAKHAVNSLEKCNIYVVSDLVLKRLSLNYNVALRHELGHCNGWGADHKGGRKVPVDYPATMLQLPASTRILPAYPPIICVTPDWKQESCAKRLEGAWAYSRSFPAASAEPACPIPGQVFEIAKVPPGCLAR